MRRLRLAHILGGLAAVLAALVLTAAVGVGLFRFAASAVPHARGKIEAWAERRLALRLRLRTIDLVWRRLHPEFVLRGVHLVGPKGSTSVAVRRLAFGISWSGLLSGRLRPSWMGLDGLSLPLVQDADGHWRLPRGLAPLLAATSQRPVHPFEGGIRLRDARFLLHSPAFGPSPLLVHVVRFRLRSGDDRARLRLEALVPDWGRARLLLDYDARGPRPWKPWRKGTHWRVSWRLEGLNAGVFLLALHPAWKALDPHGLLRGRGDLDGRGLVFDGRANLALARFRWRERRGVVASFGLRLRAGVRSAEGRTAVALSVLGMRSPHGKTPAPLALRLLLHPTAVGTDVRARIARLSLSSFRLPLAAARSFAGRAPAWLGLLLSARPRGRFLGTHVVARWRGGRPVAWALHGKLLGFRSRSVGLVPGLRLPPVRLALGNVGGGIAVEAGAIGLRDRRWGGPERIVTTSGFVVDYRRSTSGLSLTLPALGARSPAGPFRLRTALRFPASGHARIRLALAAQSLSLTKIRTALPSSLWSAGFTQWLGRAFPDGGVLRGLTIRWHGALVALPCIAAKGCPVVQAEARLPRFIFAPGWPALEHARIRISYREGRFVAVLHRGTFAGWRPGGARVVVGPNARRLGLRLVFSGPLAPAWRALGQTPLASGGGLVHRLEVTAGGVHGRLAILVPFARPRRTTVRGDLALRGVDLGLGSKLSSLTTLTGRLVFVPGGVITPALDGRWLGVPFHLGASLARGVETLHAAGGLPAPAVVAALSGGPAPSWIAGQARWSLAAALTPGGDDRFVWRSSLKGVRIGLHAPLGKAGSARRPLVLIARTDPRKVRLRLRYGRLGRGSFRASSARGPWNGAVVFGGGRPVLPAAGVAVEGRLAELDLRDLVRLLSLGRRRRPKAAPPGAVFRLRALEIGRVVGYGQDFGPLSLRGSASPDRVHLALASASVAGTLRYRRSERDPRGLVRLYLTRLDLARPHHSPPKPGGPARQGGRSPRLVRPARHALGHPSPRPGVFPALDLTSLSTRLGSAHLGRVVARFRPAPHAWILSRLQAQGPGYALEAHGYWARHAGGDRVRFLFTLSSRDVHTAFLAFGLTPLMTGRSAVVRGDLGWHGVPWRPNRPTVSGVVSLVAHGGRVLPLNPGAGRLLGLLSLSSLPERLGLDFSDVFDRGLAYNVIRGRFRITNGVATIPALVLHGPAVRLRLEGRADLVGETYDEVVRVVPLVSATLPLAGAVVGGPVGFAALLVLSRVLALPMRTLLATYYHIGGTWTHPLVHRISDGTAHRLGFRTTPAP